MRFNRQKHYLFPEIMGQIREVKRRYGCSDIKAKCGIVTCNVMLQPTESSPRYKIQLKAMIGKKTVDVHVIDPPLQYWRDGERVPHIYSDKALCLYYPKYHEREYTDLWADTIIPWTALWLYYYEIWLETGEWLGGGIHGASKNKNVE